MQRPVLPGGTSLPFVDFREIVAELSPLQQVDVMGRASLTLVEEGVVGWGDVVSTTRVRTLQEVVSLKKLGIEDMTKAGVPEGVAARAYAAVNTPTHATAGDAIRAASEKLAKAGISPADVVKAAAGRVAARVTIGGPATPAEGPGPLYAAPKGKAKGKAVAKAVAPATAATLGLDMEEVRRKSLELLARNRAEREAEVAAFRAKLDAYGEGEGGRKRAEVLAKSAPVVEARAAWEKAKSHADELTRMLRAAEDPAERAQVQAALDRAQSAYKVALEAKESAEARLRGSLASILRPGGPRGGLAPREGSIEALDANYERIAAENAVLWYSRVLAAPRGDAVEFGFKKIPGGGRPYYDDATGTVHLSGSRDVGAAIHEIGHMLESRAPGWNAAAQQFLRHRVGDEAPARLDGLFPDQGFRPDETGRKDRFDEAFPAMEAYYVGKDYGKGASEVTAMGVEMLFNDPATLAAKDPEYFHFIAGLLDGSLR